MTDTKKAAGRRQLGIGFDGKPICEPKPSRSLVVAPAGSGKTTNVAIPWLFSLLADPSPTLVIGDGKDAEVKAVRRRGRTLRKARMTDG